MQTKERNWQLARVLVNFVHYYEYVQFEVERDSLHPRGDDAACETRAANYGHQNL